MGTTPQKKLKIKLGFFNSYVFSDEEGMIKADPEESEALQLSVPGFSHAHTASRVKYLLGDII